VGGGDEGHAEPAQERQMKPVDMDVDHVELAGAPRDGVEQRRLRRHRVRPWPAEPQRPRPDRLELGAGF
jgi:hypothetical protein